MSEKVGLLMSYVWSAYLGFKTFRSHNGGIVCPWIHGLYHSHRMAQRYFKFHML